MLKNFFRTFIFSFVVLLMALYGIAYLLPDTYTVERSIEIHAPKEKVYAQVINLQDWKNWSYWAKKDPEAKYAYGSNMQNLPFMEWNGANIGVGRLDVVKADLNHRIETSLQFYTPYQGNSQGIWIFEGTPQVTTVTWKNHGTLDDLMSKYYGLVMDKTIGNDFQKGLDSLKTLIEK